MRRFFLLMALLGASLAFPTAPLLAQRSAVADVGFSYQNIQKPPGLSPFSFEAGRILLTDSTELTGQVRLQTRRGQTVVAYNHERTWWELFAQMLLSGPSLGENYMPMPRIITNDRELLDDQVREFFLGEHHYVRRPEISIGWLEIIRDTGSRLHLYQQHGRGPNYLARNAATGVVTYIPSRLPIRGYNIYFEDALRPLFADRADLLKLLNGHYITTYNLDKVVDAYNSGQPVQF